MGYAHHQGAHDQPLADQHDPKCIIAGNTHI